MKSSSKIASIIVKLIGVCASIYGLVRIVESWDTFTYFTVLSNIFIIVMLGIFLFIDIKCFIKKEDRKIGNLLYIVKFLSTASITLTFFVYMFLLAPTYEQGFLMSYMENGAGSFCVHFIAPILTIIDFCLFDTEYKSNNKHCLYAVIPPSLYVVLVVIMGQCGYRWNGMIAPYNFLNYKAETGWLGFDLSTVNEETLGIGVIYMVLLLLVIFIIIGRVLLLIRRKNVK